MPKGGFVYRGKNRSADDIAKKAKEGTRDYDSIFQPGLPVFKPRDGANWIRILPSADAENPDWDLVVHTHYDVGPDNARYLCLDKMKGEPCPVCEAKAEATDEEEADKLRVVKGAICGVIDRDAEKEGPKLWSIPFTKIRNEIYARSSDKKTRTPILIDDPDEGFDIEFNRKGEGTRTQYTGVEVVRDPSPLSENEKTQQRWLDFITEHPLSECLVYHDYDYIKKVLYGKKASRKKDDDDEDEDESPRSRRLRKEEDDEDESPRSKRRSKLDDDDEEDESPRSRSRVKDEDDDEEEESPRSRRSKAKEDEDDEIPSKGRSAKRRALLDDDEDEDDDAPAPKRSAKKPAEDEDEDEEDDEPSASAKRTLGRLRPASKRR